MTENYPDPHQLRHSTRIGYHCVIAIKRFIFAFREAIGLGELITAVGAYEKVLWHKDPQTGIAEINSDFPIPSFLQPIQTPKIPSSKTVIMARKFFVGGNFKM